MPRQVGHHEAKEIDDRVEPAKQEEGDQCYCLVSVDRRAVDVAVDHHGYQVVTATAGSCIDDRRHVVEEALVRVTERFCHLRRRVARGACHVGRKEAQRWRVREGKVGERHEHLNREGLCIVAAELAPAFVGKSFDQVDSDFPDALFYLAYLAEPESLVEHLAIRRMLRRIHPRRDHLIFFARLLGEEDDFARKARRTGIDVVDQVGACGDPVAAGARSPDQGRRIRTLYPAPGFVIALFDTVECVHVDITHQVVRYM